jgi:hypothetical protein
MWRTGPRWNAGAVITGRETSTVDDEPHEVAPGQAQAVVGRAGGRPWRRVDAFQPQVALEAGDQLRVDGLRRAVVNDDHLIVVGSEVALVPGA